MKDIAIDNIRNFALLGHTGSGKTTLVDAMLFNLGLNDRQGNPSDGTSMVDFLEQEKSRKISIVAKTFCGVRKEASGGQTGFFVTDTPGYMDFYGAVVASVGAADAALVVIDAAAGIQVGTQRAMRCCRDRGPQAKGIVVSGIDKDNTDFEQTLAAIQSTFGAGCIPVVLPLPDKSGVVDVLAARDIPDELAERVAEAKGGLVELAAETDDSLIEKYLEGQDLSPDEIAKGLVQSVADGALIPVFVTATTRNIGVNELLNGMARLFPSPLAHPVRDADGNAIDPAPEAPFVGQVFRSVNDAFVGQLTYVRVLGGTLSSESEIQNVTRGQKEKVGNLLIINGKKQETIAAATAGDIVAIPKLKITHVGDTLGSPTANITCSPIVFPTPVIARAVTARTQADEDKIGTALQRITEEDPTLQVERNAETKETVIKGLGDVHLDIAVDLMKTRSNVTADLSIPRVAYRETVTALGEGHYKHKKQSGGRGQYGEVYLRVEPRQPDDEEWFVDAIVGGVIPGNFLPAVQKGLVEGQQKGAVAGYPVTGVKITVYDGSYHDVDSSEVAFKIAGSRAFRDAMSKAKPVLLEPIMTVKATIPDDCMGDVNGDLSHKRGRILGLEVEDGMQVIVAEVPFAELFHYAAELRSITGGRGTFEMAFNRYDIVPSNIAQKIVAESKTEDVE